MGVIGAKKFSHWETNPVKVFSRSQKYRDNYDQIKWDDSMKCPECKHWNRCPSCNGCFCEKCGTELARTEPGGLNESKEKNREGT